MADKANLKATVAENRKRRMAEGGEVDRAPAATEEEMQSPMPMMGAQTSVNVLNPSGDLVSLPQEQVSDALQNGYQQASPEDVNSYVKEQKYGTPGQQVITGLEGAASGIAGPFAPAIEKGFGVNPEDIKGREEVNPWIHGVSQAVGLVGGAATGVGEGAVLEGVGQGVRAALPAGKATFLGQIGPEAVKSAFEGALFQAGEDVARKVKEDPEMGAGAAMMDIGLAGVMGGVFGGPIGALLQKAKYAGMNLPEHAAPAFVSELDRPALEAGDLAMSVKHSNNLKPEFKENVLNAVLDRSEKAEAPAIRAAAERLGAPVLEGMVSDNEWVQKGENALINGAPTYSGIKRKALYDEAYGKAAGAVEEALGDPSRYTKAELGNVMKESISSQLREQNEPIAQLYNIIKESHSAIPLSERSAPAIARNIGKIQELRLSPSSPEGALAARVIKEIENLKTVDDVKVYKSILNRSIGPTASSGEKRMVGILSDKLTDLEENSIERFARANMKTPEAYSKVMGLIGQRKAANAKYAELIGKVKTLSEQLGKGRVYGIQDALHFINEKLSPEEVVQRLGTTKDSEFRKFFAKEFSEQHELMKEYQKGALRDESSKAGELSHKILFNKVNKLEPEIQKSIFNPGELQKLQDAEQYIRSFPKDFNPSGTSHMSAFREFFTHPTGAAMANARDFAIDKFVKNVAQSPEIKQAVSLAEATAKGERLANKSVKALFDKASQIPAGALAPIAARTKLDKLVTMYAQNPDKMFNSGDNNPVPAYAQAFSAASARAVQYLNSVKPNTDQQSPLDAKRKPSPAEQAAYNRALDIAQQPLVVLDKMKRGTMTVQDLATLKAVHPDVYKNLQQKLMTSVMDQVHKGQLIPYSMRQQLSLFLGQPLDSTMTPQGILNAQVQFIKNSAPAQGQAPKKSTEKLNGLAKSAMTGVQSREAARAGQQKD